jgi:siroheme synthase-like protein
VQSIEPSAFPVALNLRARTALVIGGGEEAVQKVPKLLAAGAQVTIVAPSVAEELAQLARERRVMWFARAFVPSDVLGAQLVLLTEVDPGLARALRALAPTARFWLGAIDQPDYSDFFLVSTIVRGPVQIAISTGGRAPLLARRLRQALDRALDARFGEFARSFAALRARVRTLPKAERSEVLERALVGFAMEVRLRYPEGNGQGAGYPPDETRDE